ncbi:DUF1481 domain-containing protein [Erwinia pyri]|uniref:DUF1481 domain-containing protein n=1 Tax=Erwinia pyri TaxID=3062598 RepID=A0AA50HMM1_9GAMM|nr:DUF1481 domain-containing protein [Erwinia sp. DE2]WLS78667.1 DUF1481 domain-containing protein [Erwinia sp. DE2]
MKRHPFTFSTLALMLLMLAGCSSRSTRPDFTASGYLADRGTVRIWRKDNPNHSSHLVTVYTPFTGGNTETTDYLWQQEKLISIERHIKGEHPDDVTLRFDQDGSLSFMQRQLEGRREALSPDAVALYQFDAGRMLKISDDLLEGRVWLKQGHWSPSGTVTLCKGGEEKPSFDPFFTRYITQHQQESGKPVSISWLEAPKGTQLILVSADDQCATEPQEADL